MPWGATRAFYSGRATSDERGSQAEAERHARLSAAAQEQAHVAIEDAAVRLEAQQVPPLFPILKLT